MDENLLYIDNISLIYRILGLMETISDGKISTKRYFGKNCQKSPIFPNISGWSMWGSSSQCTDTTIKAHK